MCFLRTICLLSNSLLMSLIDCHMFTCPWKLGILECKLKVSFIPKSIQFVICTFWLLNHLTIDQTPQFIYLLVYEFFTFQLSVPFFWFLWIHPLRLFFLLWCFFLLHMMANFVQIYLIFFMSIFFFWLFYWPTNFCPLYCHFHRPFPFHQFF